jgi:hypothetical protein
MIAVEKWNIPEFPEFPDWNFGKKLRYRLKTLYDLVLNDICN